MPSLKEFQSAAGLGSGPVLNAEGEYVDVEQDGSWQDAWAKRASKASTMSPDEVLMAARGAGNRADGPESAAARKRRAAAACRSDALRAKANAGNQRECNARVLDGGETDFILGALQ